jgi:ATP-dependent DNA helicase DinG
MGAMVDAGVTDWRTVLSYTTASEREKRLEHYKATERAVILAPSFDRGIDLPGDLCRVQIVAKVPYPSLGDKQVSARLYSAGGQTWFNMETIRTLCQMFGRGMRKPDDWCWTYILDEQVNKLLQMCRGLFPRDVLDAIQQAGYMGMTPAEVARREVQRCR